MLDRTLSNFDYGMTLICNSYFTYLRVLSFTTLFLFLCSYPDNGFSALKVFLWLFAIVFGVVVGKLFVHYYLLCHKLQLKIFSKDGQGSLVVILFFTVCTLYYQSFVYNAFLIMCGNSTIPYQISSNMHIENKTFMKWVAVIVWSSDLLTAWMILDVMLQVGIIFLYSSLRSTITCSKLTMETTDHGVKSGLKTLNTHCSGVSIIKFN